MASGRVILFGPPTLLTETGEIRTFGTRRAALLLATLALAPGRRFSRAELAERLWPEDDPEATTIRLRQELMRLRKLLGEGVLLAEGGAVSLDAGRIESDVSRFRDLLANSPEAAVAVAVGPFLEGYREPWVQDERQRLGAAKAGAVEKLRRTARAEGRPDDAVRWARLAVFDDPLGERANLALVGSLGDAGQTAEAAREGARYVARLKSELGLEPSPGAQARLDALTEHLHAPEARPLPRTLPVELTTLYGREAEMGRLVATLDGGVRLLTLTGLGGIGKTRMAVALGNRLEGRFEGRVLYVPLSDVRDGRAIVSRVLAQSGAETIQGREDLSLLADGLPDGPMLLVLDNLEHLGEAARGFVEAILGRKPCLQILATSRHALGIVGERVVRLGPLRLPEADEADLGTVPSVALFVERAQNALGSFDLDAANSAPVAELVRRLGGLPLAIHLAASRARALTPGQMLEGIDRQDDLLVGRGTEFATERHRSLRAALEWSLGLLGPTERRTFASLSVFQGGWTIESATAVCGESRALERIEELLDRSLIESARATVGMRFQMLEPLREIAGRERDAGLDARHAAYFAEAAQEMLDRTLFDDRREFLRWHDAELGNLRAALAYGAAHDLRSAHRLFGHAWRYFCVRGYYEEGRRWAEALLGRVDPDDDSPYPSHTEAGGAVLMRDQGDHLAALALLAKATAGYVRVGRRSGIAFCRANASRSCTPSATTSPASRRRARPWRSTRTTWSRTFPSP